MELYLTQEGVRQGPFRLFQIKEMLDRGETRPGALGWHDGLADWRPLREIEALQPYLPTAERTLPPPLPTAGHSTEPVGRGGATGAALAPGTVVVVARESAMTLFGREALPRWAARVTDLCLAAHLFFLVGYAVGRIQLWQFALADPYQLRFVAAAVVWVFIEAWCLSRFGATPGKWLFCLRVRDEVTGGWPTFSQALNRSLSVAFRGVGFSYWPMSWMASLFSLQLLLQLRVVPWDAKHRTRVERRPLLPWGPIFFCLGVVGSLGLDVWMRHSFAPPTTEIAAREQWDKLMAQEQEVAQQMQRDLSVLLKTPPPQAAPNQPPQPVVAPPPGSADAHVREN
jgi:RDD family/GYF domain 2